ncbi:MAG: type II secretion system protein [Patescibacteria group bacterium]|nr:type II secretion system protein [Patescibacteria group bacterium]
MKGDDGSHSGRTRHRGFSLVELLVVLAIMVIITTIALTSQSAFNKTLILANTAYDVALTLRSAETYGLGNRVAGSVANAGYGIDFQKATPGSFILFADTSPQSSNSTACHPNPDPSAPNARPGNCVYDAGSGEKVTSYALGNGITISDFCAYQLSVWSCASGGLSSLDIIFSRPNPDPFISVNGSYSTVSPATRACLTLSSPQGGLRFISVGASGEITANAASCP